MWTRLVEGVHETGGEVAIRQGRGMDMTRRALTAPAWLRLSLVSAQIIALALAVSACSIKQMALGPTSEIIQDAVKTFYDEEDLVFAREAMAGNIKLVESLAMARPDDPKLAVTASQAFTGYAFSFFEADLAESYDVDDDRYETTRHRAAGFYRRGRAFALNVLEDRCPGFFALRDQPDEWKAALALLTVDEVPALFWTAFSWGSLINVSREDPIATAYLPRVREMMARVNELDETYFHAGAHMFFGTLFASLPEMAGGDTTKSLAHFDRCHTLTQGRFLLSQVYKARFYARAMEDRALFEAELKKVIEAPVDILPGQRMFTQVAKHLAQIHLSRIEDYFL